MKQASSADKMAEWVVTLCGRGRLPVAPGTWGTLGAAAIHALVAGLLGTRANPVLLPALCLLFTLACVVYCPWAERFYRKKDPPSFVIDEAAGYLLAVSFFSWAPQLWTGILVFFLCRLFDITKPVPCRRVEKLPSGLGIVLDDLIAGLYAALFTWLAVWLFF